MLSRLGQVGLAVCRLECKVSCRFLSSQQGALPWAGPIPRTHKKEGALLVLFGVGLHSGPSRVKYAETSGLQRVGNVYSLHRTTQGTMSEGLCLEVLATAHMQTGSSPVDPTANLGTQQAEVVDP